MKTEFAVVGAGPGGYAAAFYAADLGKKTVLVEREARLGGVCLNHGCIPSKALLQATHQIVAARESARRGIHFQPPRVELKELRDWKNSIITKLAGGLAFLARSRGVTVLSGQAQFESSNRLRVATAQGTETVEFDQAIIATGSSPAACPTFAPDHPRVMTSTGALELDDIPEDLLVIGGGYIGLELGSIYAGLGSRVVIAEALDTILGGADPELVKLVAANAARRFKEVRLNARVGKLSVTESRVQVEMELATGTRVTESYDRVLVAMGRVPNSANLGLEHTRVAVDAAGFVRVGPGGQTDDPAIYAIGDVVGGPLLAHKAHREARAAVEAITGRHAAGKTSHVIPAVVFTDPELAWCGLSEAEARQQGIPYEVARFPWSASGRALSYDRIDGLTKMLVDPATGRVLGVGIVGVGAGELIAEAVLALNLGATAADIAAAVHPHPTLSETLMECAETFRGHATHVMSRKRP